MWGTLSYYLGLSSTVPSNVTATRSAPPAPLAYSGRLDLLTATSVLTGGGDVAQVSDLPADVQAAFGIYPDAGTPIARRDAMQVPAFARGRNVIAGTIGTLKLEAWRGRERVSSPRQLLDQPDPSTTRQHVLTWTVDDLLCYGVAWWRILERDGWDYPTRAERLDRSRVLVDATTRRVYVDGKAIADRDVIRFDGPHEGVLTFAGDILRAALSLERAVKRYADNPQPHGYLYDKRPVDIDAADLDATARAALITQWDTANRSNPTRFLNRATGYEALTWDPATLDLQNARQQAAVQVARALNMPSRQVNAPSETGMTYQNVSSDRVELLDVTLGMYLTALEQRLSAPDVTPPGQTVRFDRDGFTQGSTAERLDNAKTFMDAGLGTPDEARELYLGLSPADEDTMPAAPARPAIVRQENTA